MTQDVARPLEEETDVRASLDVAADIAPAEAASAATAARRHCMIVYAYYPLGEPRVQREAEALVHAGYHVDVVCLRGEGEPEREQYRGVEVHRVGQRRDKRSLAHQLLGYLRFTARASLRLTRLHLAHRYDSVQVHNLPDFLVFSALFPKMRGVPVILDLHDLMPEFFQSRFGNSVGRRSIQWQERLSCRFADHVITVSEHWRRALIERGVPPEKVSVVMNVADDSIFRPQAQQAASADAFRLVYHGTVTHRYGLDLAVRAVALLRERIPGIRLMILGKGDLMPELFRLRDELGLEREVKLRDEVVLVEDLPHLLRDADLGVVPYRNDVFTDGLLPTKLMEYAAMRIPSIASRTTAIETYFRDSMVDFFQPGNARDLARCILQLYDDPARRCQLARRADNFARRYNWRDTGRHYVELVASLART